MLGGGRGLDQPPPVARVGRQTFRESGRSGWPAGAPWWSSCWPFGAGAAVSYGPPDGAVVLIQASC
eukprot:11157685-Lingulodinium_polyedra.AAC.1